jgi:hypothetical protein
MTIIQIENRLFWQRDGDVKPTFLCRASPGLKELLQEAIDTGKMPQGSFGIELGDLLKFSKAALEYRREIKKQQDNG